MLLEGERWAAVAAHWEALAPGAELAAAVDGADTDTGLDPGTGTHSEDKPPF